MNTKNINYKCKFDKYVTTNKDTLIYRLDLKKQENENKTLKLNILLGNTEKCNCINCNPDTRNV